MSFARTETAIEEIESFIVAHNLQGTTIEKYLSQYILISLCSEMQNAVYMCVQEHFSTQNFNSNLQKYVETSAKKILRSFEKGEIAGFLSHFGPETKTVFNDQFINKDEYVELYANIVKARHSVAHGEGCNISFLEIKSGIDVAKLIIEAIKTALGETVVLNG